MTASTMPATIRQIILKVFYCSLLNAKAQAVIHNHAIYSLISFVYRIFHVTLIAVKERIASEGQRV